MFGPHGAHLRVGCKLTTGGGGFRGGDGGMFFRRERHWQRLVVRAGKPEDNPGDVVLGVGRQVAGDLQAPDRVVPSLVQPSTLIVAKANYA